MEKRILSLVLTLTILASICVFAPLGVSAETYSPIASIDWNGHTYLLYDVGMTWYEAEKFCENQGGHLVTITSNQEHEFIYDNFVKEHGMEVMIGLSDSLSEDDWKWITGEKFSYSNWDSGEPNNYRDNENYVCVYDNGFWNDDSLDEKEYPFVCEIDNYLENAKSNFEKLIYKDAEYFNGNYYKIFDNHMNWYDSKAFCEALGGHLVTITSQEEQNFIELLLKDYNGDEFFIGLHRDIDNLETWVTGEKVVYDNWGEGEPDDAYGGQETGVIATNYSDAYSNVGHYVINKYQWDDNSDGNRKFICEWDSSKKETDEEDDIIVEIEPSSSEKEAFIQEHLDFVESNEYAERIDVRWGEIIASGLNTPTSNTGETMYNVLNSVSEILQCNELSIFENPYDLIVSDLIIQEANLALDSCEEDYSKALSTYISQFNTLCEMSTDEWEPNTDYELFLEELIKNPENFQKTKPELFKKFENVFSKMSTNRLNKILNIYDKATVLLDGYNKGKSVVTWISDCIKFNALVDAYRSTSDEFKNALALSATTLCYRSMYGTMEEELYATLLTESIAKYDEFLEEDANEVELLFEVYIQQGMDKVTDVFGDAIRTHVLNWFTKGLGIEKTKALTWVEAAIFGYNTGMFLGDLITNNDEIMDCRELLRANYYLEQGCYYGLEDNESDLLKNKDYQSALDFDASYKLLKYAEIYSLKTYKKYLEKQQGAFSNGLLHGFNWSYNDSEIEIADAEIQKWQNSKCHGNNITFISSEWAKPEIKVAYEKGLLPESMINDDLTQEINRAEFATISVNLYAKISGENVSAGNNPFDDISSDFYKTDIIKAYNLGIVSGISNNEFAPNGEITREQAATMLMRTAEALGFDTSFNASVESGVSSWATEGVGFVTENGIMNGTGNGFEPQGKYTKEQAIATFIRMFNNLK